MNLAYRFVPVIALVVLLSVVNMEITALIGVLVTGVLLISVLVAVHHAEVIAHRVGEPFGTLVLALAVTCIEASLIVSLMIGGGEHASALARDTVFATVMIICNGVIGICLLVGALKYRTVSFQVDGTNPSLAALAVLTSLTLILPVFTTSTMGPTFSPSQLLFAGIASGVVYGVYVFVQTVRHREYFLSESDAPGEEAHPQISSRTALSSLLLLVISLVSVVGLAKVLSPQIEKVVHEAGFPYPVVGIAIAMMVLLPETIAAVRAARKNRMQSSFNLALGSALATIGLTIPVVAITAITFDLHLVLGLDQTDIAMLAVTMFVSSITLSRGNATVMQGALHLILFVVFIFLSMVP